MKNKTEKSINYSPVSPCVQNKRYSKYGLPEYLVKHYWWAYLSPVTINFFDYTFIVNRILWGQYTAISDDALEWLSEGENKKIAGISCAYGDFFPRLSEIKNLQKLYMFDIAPLQVKQMQNKIVKLPSYNKCQFLLSNAEQIALMDNSVDNAVLFFLLHELPVKARLNTLFEAIRITKKGGRITIADYAPIQKAHFFHKNNLFTRGFEKLEPFLADFWRCNLLEELTKQAEAQGRTVQLCREINYWQGFYRLIEFVIK